MLRALANWRRKRILREAPLDDALWRDSLRRIPYAHALSPGELERLRELVILFLHEKAFAAAAGLQLNDAMRVYIAIQACILVLGLGLEYYRGWSGIVVYPRQFVPQHQRADEFGIVHQGDEPYMGEAWLGGPVILSWEDVEGADWPDGVNVVIHEFAHKLDMLNGDANGYPPLHAGMTRETWAQVFEAAYADFCARVDAGGDTIIDPYASESPGEFFAVLSEAFFEIPDVVQAEYGAVYDQLKAFYRQDPLVRLAGVARMTVA